MKYVSESGRTFTDELICLRDENNYLKQVILLCKSTNSSTSVTNLVENEKMILMSVLVKHRYNRKLTADELGISERTVYRKLKEFNIDDYSLKHMTNTSKRKKVI